MIASKLIDCKYIRGTKMTAKSSRAYLAKKYLSTQINWNKFRVPPYKLTICVTVKGVRVLKRVLKGSGVLKGSASGLFFGLFHFVVTLG